MEHVWMLGAWNFGDFWFFGDDCEDMDFNDT